MAGSLIKVDWLVILAVVLHIERSAIVIALATISIFAIEVRISIARLFYAQLLLHLQQTFLAIEQNGYAALEGRWVGTVSRCTSSLLDKLLELIYL